MMAESLDDGEFWLPPQFLADDDTILDEKSSGTYSASDHNWFGSTSLSGGRASFPMEFGTLGVFSDFSSPGESVKGSSETESDEEEFVTNLTLRMAHSTIDDGFGGENPKARLVSGSPQSILCDMGSGSGCSQGSSRGSPKGQCKVSSPPATWDLLHAAAGEVAKMRMNESHGVHHSKGLSDSSERTSQVSVPMNSSNSGAGFYQHMQAMHFQNLQNQEMIQRQNLAVGEQLKAPAGYQQQQIHQMIQGGVRNGDFVGNRDRRSVGLSSSAWLPPPQRQGSGMRALFLGTPGGKRGCPGTGVFLPRHIGTQPEPRKKPACSTVLVPARVMQALNLNLDDICNQPHLQPVGAGRFNSEKDVLLRLQSNNRGAAHQKRNSRRQPAMDHEIKLPQEWTY